MSCSCLLAELNDQRFSVSAFAAFKCALVFTGVVSRLNANKKHRQPACRAAALANRRRWQTQFAWLRHDYLPGVFSYGLSIFANRQRRKKILIWTFCDAASDATHQKLSRKRICRKRSCPLCSRKRTCAVH